jgi:hypothetical protein
MGDEQDVNGKQDSSNSPQATCTPSGAAAPPIFQLDPNKHT